MKALHRLMVTSSTYRMASTNDPADARRDPDNRYLWRMNPRRMDAEVVRDNVLCVADSLDRTRGGPDIDQNLGMTVPRRSLYFRHAAEKEMEFLALFNQASVTECYRRKETVAPQQALALANSDLAVKQARRLARELSKADASSGTAAHATLDAAFVSAAFEGVLCRPPTKAELAECLKFLAAQAERVATALPTATTRAQRPSSDLEKPAGDPALRAREDLVLVLLNHNDFVTIR
jgi:hypothetical protein